MRRNGLHRRSVPRARLLYLVDSGNRAITAFAIDLSTGALTLLPNPTIDRDFTGPGFDAAAIDPKDRFVYVGGPSYSFTGYSLTPDPATGTLPVLPGMPVQVTPTPTTFNAGSRYMADRSVWDVPVRQRERFHERLQLLRS